MYRHGSIEDYMNLGWDDFSNEFPLSTKDTYFMIFGPKQQDEIPNIEKIIEKRNGVVLYQSPKAINFGYNDEPRNTLIVFEFNAVQV